MEGLTATKWFMERLVAGHHLKNSDKLREVNSHAANTVKGKSEGTISRDPTLYAADLCLRTLGVMESQGCINQESSVKEITAKIAEGIVLVSSVLEVEEPGA